MINEWEEFCAYTGTVSYTASKKSDTTWLGRFTFATILEFEGMSRILTVLARGYLFHGKDGAVISGDPHDRVGHARRALCAWCSVPEDGKRVQDKEWQFQRDFSELHTEFPELVDADGVGWFLRHVLRAADFMLTHPEKVRSTSLKYAEVIQSKFAAAWRSKVKCGEGHAFLDLIPVWLRLFRRFWQRSAPKWQVRRYGQNRRPASGR